MWFMQTFHVFLWLGGFDPTEDILNRICWNQTNVFLVVSTKDFGLNGPSDYLYSFQNCIPYAPHSKISMLFWQTDAKY